MTPAQSRMAGADVQSLQARARLELARRSVVDAARWRNPRLSPVPWQRELGALCDRVVESVLDRTGLRVTISAPPRHGKSEFVGRSLPIRVYLEAARRGEPVGILYVTSTGGRAEEVSRRVRSAVERIWRETGDPAFEPGEKWSSTEWETKGGLAWVGCGWGAALGGIGARLVIMDDMIGSSEVYRSPSKRGQIQRVVQEDVLSRLMDGGAAVHMETRRGLDDTTGWLLREYPGTWEEHVWRCYDEARSQRGAPPAQGSQAAPSTPQGGQRDPESGRDPAAYLWPEVYGEAWRRTMPHLTDSSPVWRALYQQEPVPEGGTLIPIAWTLATYPEPPEAVRALADLVAIGCDLTNTKKKTSDEAAFVVVAKRGAWRDLLHVVVRRCGYVEQRQILRDLVATWRPHVVVVERAAGGDQMLDELAGEIPGIQGFPPVGDKVTRLTPFLGAFAALQVRTPVAGAPWVGRWREEMSAFAGIDGETDNQVDATVWALRGCEIGAVAPSVDQVRAALRSVWGGR